MFLSKRSNGIYYIFYEQPNGKRTCISTNLRTKKEALLKYAKFVEDQERQLQQTIIPITLNQFMFQYLKYSSTFHTTNTTLTYRTTFNALKKYVSEMDLAHVDKVMIDNFLQHRVNTSSIYSARKDIINIKASLNWAVGQRYLTSNPTIGIKRIRVPEKLPAYFNQEELDTFLKCTGNEDFNDLVLFAVHTGLRQAELINLKKKQIDLTNKYLILDNQSHVTKSKRIRKVPLNKTALSIASRRNEDICPSLYLFTFRGLKINKDDLIHWFLRVIKEAQLRKELHFHSLRHTFASWLVQKGVSIYEVSKLLGHADIKTTEIYAHLKENNLRSSVNLL